MTMPKTYPKHVATFRATLAFSLLAHVALFFPLGLYGSFNFAKPVKMATPFVDLSMVQDARVEPPRLTAENTAARPEVSNPPSRQAAAQAEAPIALSPGSLSKEDPQPVTREDTSSSTLTMPEKQDESPAREKIAEVQDSPKSKPLLEAVKPPLRVAAEFTSTKREQLNYRISLFGMPIGVAELEAKNDKGEVHITLKVRSTPAISAVYPVDDLIETRHIAGNFIITKIRQQEGSFRSHRGFTIFLRDRSVFWMDLLRNRTSRETIPNSQVLDLMSAFYYLRNRPLQVGRTEELHVYDSDTYTNVPVEVLRREQISLPAFRHARTVVVKPNLKTDGIFKRTGDVTIWLTDDENKVPVRLETSIPLGKITAELVSAEVDKLEPATLIPPAPPLPKQ